MRLSVDHEGSRFTGYQDWFKYFNLKSEHSFLGKLGGIVKPNDGSCHLDSKGVYTHSNDLDYPSVSQINHKVKENSVNIIFAVTEEQFNVYDLLQQNVEGSSVGTLSNDSSNIVELVKAQYQVTILIS